MNKLSLTTTSAGHLTFMPQELRDDIYNLLLRAGSLEFLRTSRQIHDEAKERLFHEAVFRVKMGFSDGRVNSFPTNWKNFERFHFRIFFGVWPSYPPMSGLFDRFTDLDGTSLKRQCLVSLEFGYNNTGPPDYSYDYPASLLEELGRLNTFASVAEEFLCDGVYEPWCKDPYGISYEDPI